MKLVIRTEKETITSLELVDKWFTHTRDFSRELVN